MIAISFPAITAVATPIAIAADITGLAAFGFYAKGKYDEHLESRLIGNSSQDAPSGRIKPT